MALVATLALAAFAAAPAPAAEPSAPGAATFAISVVGNSAGKRLLSPRGRTLRGAVLVRNLSGRRISVRLQPADIRNATSGGADYVTTRPSAAGRWIKLAATTVRLAPRASRKLAFSVRIPRRVGGASHYAGIVGFDTADLTAAAREKKRKGRTLTISRISRQALPITIQLPGRLTRGLALRSVRLVAEPAGAGLVIGLRPGGTILTQSALVSLRISRGSRTIFRHRSTLGQLFPNDDLDFRIPWNGRPTEGDYRVRGVIRPKGAKPVYIDRTVTFTPAKVTELKRETPPVADEPAAPGLPMWVWLALGTAATLLTALSLAFWRLARRARRTPGEPAPLRVTAVPEAEPEQDDRRDRTAA